MFTVSYDDYQKKFDQKSNILFITGAGISVDSGLMTYRGNGGLYTNSHDEIESILSQRNQDNRPSVIWNILMPLYEKSKTAKPNIAHYTIAKMQRAINNSMVYTQQVDDLHNKAGSSNVVEIHGNAKYAYCKNCEAVSGKSNSLYEIDNINLENKTKEGSPQCPTCKSKLRLNIVPFGGMLDEKKISEVECFVKDNVIDAVIVVGTSMQFYHIALPLLESFQKHRADIILVDPSDDFDFDLIYSVELIHAKVTASEFFENCVSFKK